MPIQVNSPGWKIRRTAGSRGVASAVAVDLPGVPPEFLTDRSRVAEEAVLEPASAARSATRSRERSPTVAPLDVSYDVEPGHTAVLAIRQQSGALTFHLPVDAVSRGARGPSQVR